MNSKMIKFLFDNSFHDDLARVLFDYELEHVKVVALKPIPKLRINFNERGERMFGPYAKDSEFSAPIWLIRILQDAGYVVFHKDERMDDSFLLESSPSLKSVSPYFYNKSLDWLSSLEHLVAKSVLSETYARKYRSQFLSFIENRIKKILELSISKPLLFVQKAISKEEGVLALYIHHLLEQWESMVLKRKD
ncbi:MAG: hypothetical protein ACTSVI_10715 [Promethearchaeota archaeon]